MKPIRRRITGSVAFWQLLCAAGASLVIVSICLTYRKGSGREFLACTHECRQNLRRIVAALYHYHDVNGAFPPAYTVDAQGEKLHSWRAVILPYLNEQRVFETIDFSKRWDDPVNAVASGRAPAVFRCKCTNMPQEVTTYAGMVGQGCFFGERGARSLRDIVDEHSETVMLLEMPTNEAVPWMAPEDVGIDVLDRMRSGKVAGHGESLTVVWVDGHIASLPLTITSEEWQSFLSIAGGEADRISIESVRPK